MEPQKRARLLNNQANELMRSGKYREALQKYMEALRLAPDIPELYYNVGVALAALDRFEEARIAFYKSRQLGLNGDELPIDVYLAYCEAKVGNLEKARKLLPDLIGVEGEEAILKELEKILDSHNGEYNEEDDRQTTGVPDDQG